MFICDVGTLSDIVKEIRREHGLSQDELAKMLGVNGQTVSNLETGKTKKMKMAGMRKLAEIANRPVAELLADPASGEPSIEPIPHSAALLISPQSLRELAAAIKENRVPSREAQEEWDRACEMLDKVRGKA